MELRDALSQIAEIRQQMARGQTFRGYRSATTAFSGFLAIVTALFQHLLVPDPALAPRSFVLLWAAAAMICLIVVGAEMFIRTRRSPAGGVQRELTLMAVEQFMPSVVVGAVLAGILCAYYPHLVWLLPGLWMILFSLGVFASCRLLPHGAFAVAGFYLIAGILALIVSPGHREAALMGAAFSLGQLALAAILYFRLERPRD